MGSVRCQARPEAGTPKRYVAPPLFSSTVQKFCPGHVVIFNTPILVFFLLINLSLLLNNAVFFQTKKKKTRTWQQTFPLK